MRRSLVLRSGLLLLSSLISCAPKVTDRNQRADAPDAFHARTLGSDVASDIISKCTASTQSKSESPIGDLINETRNRFASPAMRFKDPEGLVRALDEIVARSEFAPILGCRDRVPYRLKFIEPSNAMAEMSVTPHYSDKHELRKLTLNFSLNTSFERVLFVYIHELTHVCQAPKTAEIWSRMQGFAQSQRGQPGEAPRLEDARGEYYRDHFAGEVEAFRNMAVAYAKLVRLSATLCHEGESRAGLYQVYANLWKAYRAGVFAQPIVAGYLNLLKPNEEYVLDIHSPILSYRIPGAAETVKLRRLHPLLHRTIEAFGVPVTEPVQ